MKATIEIIDGFCTIVLKAENQFEKTLIEDFETENQNSTTQVTPRTDSEQYGNSRKNHRIIIDIKRKITTL
jgi:hypothetical protein